MPVVIDMEDPLAVALREVPEKEYAEAEPAVKRANAAENFMLR